MKNFLIFIFSLLTILSKAQTTIYHPFPDSSAVWNNYFYWSNSDGLTLENDYYSIIISGDTIINNQSYHKLFIPYVRNYLHGSSQTILSGYKGCIRQDKVKKLVFIVPPTKNTEEILYDFSLHVGDTLKSFIDPVSGFSNIVISTDSIIIGGSFRKVWLIDENYDIRIIEGMGSTYGLLQRTPGHSNDVLNSFTTCFQQNGQSLYTLSPFDCNLITTQILYDKLSNQIKVYPNPSFGNITVEFDNIDCYNIQLIDLLGNCILNNYVVNQKKINLADIRQGIFILRIIDKTNTIINKKIISSP